MHCTSAFRSLSPVSESITVTVTLVAKASEIRKNRYTGKSGDKIDGEALMENITSIDPLSVTLDIQMEAYRNGIQFNIVSGVEIDYTKLTKLLRRVL